MKKDKMNNDIPLVSIIVATYNRSNILYYALSSLIKSIFQEWECIVVGDACTDDTENVISSLGDSRIRFVNLKENFGEQSGPNNYGCELARGKYIAFLNHDDMWFPDHLTSCISYIEKWKTIMTLQQLITKFVVPRTIN
ncbi:hypothetical protein BVY01_00290 [bacterium I07]|nr:hypothetical protein BVY01_00290 [bacterium I07]